MWNDLEIEYRCCSSKHISDEPQLYRNGADDIDTEPEMSTEPGWGMSTLGNLDFFPPGDETRLHQDSSPWQGEITAFSEISQNRFSKPRVCFGTVSEVTGFAEYVHSDS